MLFPIDFQEYKILYSFMEASGDEHSVELYAEIEERKFSSEQIYLNLTRLLRAKKKILSCRKNGSRLFRGKKLCCTIQVSVLPWITVIWYAINCAMYLRCSKQAGCGYVVAPASVDGGCFPFHILLAKSNSPHRQSIC